MKKLEDKTNLTRLDYFIYYKQLKKESEDTNRLLDENKCYLHKLETSIQEKNYEIKQLTKDNDEINKLIALKLRENEKLIKEVKKLTSKLEKKQSVIDRQQTIINELNIVANNQKEEIGILSDRLEYCRNHRRAPDIEELKAYEFNKKEVLKKIRGKDEKCKQ